MADTVVAELEPGIHSITLNRPHRRNALSQGLLVELHARIDELTPTPPLGSSSLQGEGPVLVRGRRHERRRRTTRATLTGTRSGGSFPRTQGSTTAQLHGPGADGRPVREDPSGTPAGHRGDRRARSRRRLRAGARAATSASRRRPRSFGAVFIKRGVSACDMGSSYLLPRFVGASRSAELLLTGTGFRRRRSRTDRAADSIVVEPDQLLERAMKTARQIASNPPLAVWMTKETMWQTIDAPSFRHALDMENRTQIMCTVTGELQRGIRCLRRKARTNLEAALGRCQIAHP